VYQRKTLLERLRHRSVSVPAVSVTRPGRHVEDVRSACRVEHVRPIEETRERLAVPAVADEAEAAGCGNVACDTARAAAPAPKRKVQGHA
jgi:hypothetical protein